MAQLHKSPYPGEWWFKKDENVQEYFQRTEILFKAIPAERIMSFPVADGHAVYYVFSEKPFVLQHIPYGDAWHIPAAHLRGLKVKDWRSRVKRIKLFQGVT